MNKPSWIVLAVIVNHGYISQRELAPVCRLSIGTVNKAVKNLIAEGYLDELYRPTQKALNFIEASRPQRAVILADSTGLRIGSVCHRPHGLIELDGELLIERIIDHLLEVGVKEIYIVVGYEMERFEYLSEKYGARLIINKKYDIRGSLYSLYLAREHLNNSYIVNSNVRFTRNPFSETEYMSWYGISEGRDEDSFLRVTRKMELVDAGEEPGEPMSGVAYLTGPPCSHVKENLELLVKKRKYFNADWENALFDGEKCVTFARRFLGQSCFYIRTYEQYLLITDESESAAREIISYISQTLGVGRNELREIRFLRKGMTNRLFAFSLGTKRMVFRIPGKGSSRFIDRRHEAEVYEKIAELGISEKIVHIDPERGYRISEYIDDSRICDPAEPSDVKRCMELLSGLHGQRLSVGRTVDVFEMLEFYESLITENLFFDYAEVKRQVFSLRPLVEAFASESALCHYDSAYDNFIFDKNGDVKLIDWEYSCVCDPLVDVASFCIYAGYDRRGIEKTLAMYKPAYTEAELHLVFAYCAVQGLIWALWSEYQRQMGIDCGGYAIAQYRYAREYTPIAYRFLSDRLKSKGEKI